MGKWISSVLSNDSAFGQIMTRCGILIGANLMFCIFCLPVVTIGPSIAALYYVMFRVLRGDGVLNPFKEFWTGFRSNLKQGLLYWLLVLVLAVITVLDLRFADYQGGIMNLFRYGIYAVAAAGLMVTAYVFPVMACFRDTLGGVIRNAVFFLARNPFKMVVLVLADYGLLLFSYRDVQRLPLWGFLWSVVGFSAVAMFGASLLIKDFNRFLPKTESVEEPIEEQKNDAEDES